MPEIAQVASGNAVGDLVPGLANSGISYIVNSINVGTAITTASVTAINASMVNMVNQITTLGYTVSAANMTMQVHGEMALDLQVITGGAAGTMTMNIDLATWSAWNRNLTVTTTMNVGTAATTTLITNPWPAWTRIQNQTLPQIQRTLEQQEADRAARLAQQASYEANRIKVEGEKAKARERAAKLLQEQLTPKQREELAQKGFFSLEVISATGKRIYRINKGRSRNVQEVDANGKVLKTLCAHPQIQCPDEDTMLTQKLMLEACEPEFLRVANIQTH